MAIVAIEVSCARCFFEIGSLSSFAEVSYKSLAARCFFEIGSLSAPLLCL